MLGMGAMLFRSTSSALKRSDEPGREWVRCCLDLRVMLWGGGWVNVLSFSKLAHCGETNSRLKTGGIIRCGSGFARHTEAHPLVASIM